MTYLIYTNIPAANNDPADDQPLMQINNANIAGYLGVDHVAPGAQGDGFHKHVTYYDKYPPGAIAGQVGVSYTGAGIANPAVPENYFKNASGEFPLSCIKCFGSFLTKAPGVVPEINGYNITSITRVGLNYNIITEAGAITGDNVVVFITPDNLTYALVNSLVTTYNFTNPTLTITTVDPAPVDGRRINFAILQI